MPNNTQPIHILIADDQETDAFFIEQAFGQSTIANVVHLVRDGQEVLDFLSKKGDFSEAPRPHLIILDLKMPQVNGYEVLKDIKSNDDLCDIPVVMMSGSSEYEDIQKAYRLHANAYVPKSNGFEDMLDFVNSIEKFWFLKARLPQGPSE